MTGSSRFGVSASRITDTAPLTIIASPEVSDADLGTIPDVRVDTERLVWQSTRRVGILVQLEPMEPAFAEAISREVDRGLRGRGTCLMGTKNRLFVDIGLADSESQDSSLLDEYLAQLLLHLGLDRDAVLISEIEEIEFDAQQVAEVEHVKRGFGLHALGSRPAPQIID